MVNTYDCKKAIRASKNIITVTIIQGKIATTIYRGPAVSNPQEKPIKIFKRACPDIILANNRILKLKTFAI